MRNGLESEEEWSCVDGVYTRRRPDNEQRLYQKRKRMLLLLIFLYSAILRSRADSLRFHVILHE